MTQQNISELLDYIAVPMSEDGDSLHEQQYSEALLSIVELVEQGDKAIPIDLARNLIKSVGSSGELPSYSLVVDLLGKLACRENYRSSTLQALVALTEDDSASLGQKRIATQALSEIASSDLKSTHRKLLNDSDPTVVRYAIYATRRTNDFESLDRLLELSNDAPAPSVRSLALSTIEKLRKRQ